MDNHARPSFLSSCRSCVLILAGYARIKHSLELFIFRAALPVLVVQDAIFLVPTNSARDIIANNTIFAPRSYSPVWSPKVLDPSTPILGIYRCPRKSQQWDYHRAKRRRIARAIDIDPALQNSV
jgi:hypothetical protein